MNCTSSALGYILDVSYKIIKVIQLIVPIILIIMLAINITKLMAKPDDKKLPKKVFNSGLAAVVVFFVPVIVNAVMGMLGDDTSISSCWNSINYVGISTEYIAPYETTDPTTGFFTNPDDYQQGNPKPSPSAGTTTTSTADNPSLVDDGKYSQYKTIATCDSATMKYRIIQVSNNADLAIIWVQNPNMQLNGALAAANSMGRLPAETLLNNEISANGYQSKCMVAVNASFFSYSTNSPVGGVVINKGQIVKDSGNASGCIGVDSSNKLIECSHSSASDIAAKGVRNTFVISSPAGLDNSGPTANRTQICQIDSNNFVLLSGSGTVGGTAQITNNVTGCSYSFNLDGGGSRKLYYKDQSSSTMTKRFGGGREIPDMLYFVES